MAYPTNDDPDLNKRYRKRGDKPARGRRDAHKGQTPRKTEPQHQAQEDRRLLNEGERQGWESRGPETLTGDEAGEAGRPRIKKASRVARRPTGRMPRR